MLKMHMTACLLASALVAVPALAQTSTTQKPATGTSAPNTTMGTGNTNAAGSGTFITRREPGMFRASELIGMDVYGANNEDIGEVGDVLVDRNGQVRAVVVDIGGFLGLGETHVAVPMQSIQFRPENQQSAGMNTSGNRTETTGSTAGTGAANPNTAARQNNTTNNNQQNASGGGNSGRMPEVIVLMMNKEQLQNAPKFQDDNRASGSTGTSSPASGGGASGTGTTTAPRQ